MPSSKALHFCWWTEDGGELKMTTCASKPHFYEVWKRWRGGGGGGSYILFIHQVRSTWMGNHCRRWRDQTSVIKRKQTAVWHVCSLVLFRCLAYSDPLQTLGLCCSLSPAHTLFLALPFSIFLSLSWAAALIPSSPWLLHSSLRICKLFYISLALSASVSTLSLPSPQFHSLSLSHCLSPSVAVLPPCITILGLACLVMMRFDPPCWMILTWYPTSGRFLSRLTSKS